MNSLLNQLLTQSAAPMAHTFIVGAGDGNQLPQWRELQSEHLHLAEAHPQQAKALQQQAREHENVFAGAITPSTQTSATLHMLTLPQYSSINSPTALQRLLPNVRHQRTEDVTAQSLEGWLTQVELDPSATHTLVLDAPGQTHALLAATTPETIQAFQWIIATTAEQALYDNDADSETLNDTLNQLGYACVTEDDNAVYPTVRRLYQRQPATVERLKLTQELNQARQLAEKHKQALEDARVIARSEATKQSQALDELRVIAKSEATTQSQALEVAKKQANEYKQTLDEKTRQLTERDKQLAERDQHLKERTQQLSKKTKAFEGTEAARLAAENEAKEQSQALEEVKKKTNEHKQALDEKTRQLAERDKQLAERDKQLSEKVNALAAADKKAHEHKQALDETNQQLTERDKKLKEADTALQQLTQEHKSLQQEKSKLNEQVQTLKEELATKESRLAHTDERFGALEGKLDQLFGEQRSYIQQTTNALGQHVTRSAKQQRDEQALTHYLQYGQRPISTQLAPEFAMALLEQRDTQRYDVMLVLGSNAVTELLAQAVINETGHHQRLAPPSANTHSQNKETQRYVAPSQDDLPQAVISLLHQKTACRELNQRLAASHCHQAVNVIHAPWVEVSYQNKTSLFYASEATLQRLNGWLREDAKVLIVIGDALAQAGHSRVSALPQLLQHLPTQTLDLVLESTHYPQEEHLTSEWESLLKERERDMQKLDFPDGLGLRIEG